LLLVDDCIQNSVDSADSIEIPIVPDLSQHLKTAAGSASSLPSQTVTYCDRECDELLCSDDESFSSDCDNDYVPSSVSQSEEELDSDGTDCEGHDISHGVKLCRKGDQPKAGESEQKVCELMRSGGDQKSRLVMKSRNLGIQNIVSNSNITDDNNNAVSDTEVGTKCGRNQNIVVMLTNNSTSRKYDRKSYCCFCGVQQSKLVRHFKLKHQDEDDIRSLIGESDKAKKNLAIFKLRNLGDHEHNRTVVERGSGQFLVHYRPKADADYRSFVPCHYCYGYFSKKSIWKHLCPLAPKTADGQKVKVLRKGVTSLISKANDKTVEWNVTRLRWL